MSKPFDDLRKAARCLYVTVDTSVADDVTKKLYAACEAHEKLLAALNRQAVWLERAAIQAEMQAMRVAGQSPTFAAACQGDADVYRAMLGHLQAALPELNS